MSNYKTADIKYLYISYLYYYRDIEDEIAVCNSVHRLSQKIKKEFNEKNHLKELEKYINK